MKRWEYVAVATASIEDLNRYGADGWELVGVVPVLQPWLDDDTEFAEPCLVFKRPLAVPHRSTE